LSAFTRRSPQHRAAMFFPRTSLEFASPDEMQLIQGDLLQRHISYLAQHSRFYGRLFKEKGIDPKRIASPQDLADLPFTTKKDLDAFNSEFLCISQEEVVDICLTSGTTSNPVPLYQSKSDLERLGYNEDISFRSTGIIAKDRVMIAAAIDRCFMAGLAYFLGLSRIGAAVIRAGSSSVPVLCDLVWSYRPTGIVGVPTLLATIGKRLRAEGMEPSETGCDQAGLYRRACADPEFRTLSPGQADP
jgi:phenylacetate-CoA ligase